MTTEPITPGRHRPQLIRQLPLALLLALGMAIAPAPLTGLSAAAWAATPHADQFLIVDCLPQGTIKKRGVFVDACQAVLI
jgi:hypothetical protein